MENPNSSLSFSCLGMSSQWLGTAREFLSFSLRNSDMSFFFRRPTICTGLDTNPNEPIVLNIQPDLRCFFRRVKTPSLMPAGPDAQRLPWRIGPFCGAGQGGVSHLRGEGKKVETGDTESGVQSLVLLAAPRLCGISLPKKTLLLLVLKFVQKKGKSSLPINKNSFFFQNEVLALSRIFLV